MSFSPDIWGPALWPVLHMIAFSYPLSPTDEEKQHYFEFFRCLQFVLPCGTCSKNVRQVFRDTGFSKDIHFKGRESLSQYVYMLHSAISRKLGKKEKKNVTFDSVRKAYMDVRERKSRLFVTTVLPNKC
jgi:hypothetical protein